MATFIRVPIIPPPPASITAFPYFDTTRENPQAEISFDASEMSPLKTPDGGAVLKMVRKTFRLECVELELPNGRCEMFFYIMNPFDTASAMPFIYKAVIEGIVPTLFALAATKQAEYVVAQQKGLI